MKERSFDWKESSNVFSGFSKASSESLFWKQSYNRSNLALETLDFVTRGAAAPPMTLGAQAKERDESKADRSQSPRGIAEAIPGGEAEAAVGDELALPLGWQSREPDETGSVHELDLKLTAGVPRKERKPLPNIKRRI